MRSMPPAAPMEILSLAFAPGSAGRPADLTAYRAWIRWCRRAASHYARTNAKLVADVAPSASTLAVADARSAAMTNVVVLGNTAPCSSCKHAPPGQCTRSGGAPLHLDKRRRH